MRNVRNGIVAFVAGVVLAAILHMHFVATWSRSYAPYHWPGYSESYHPEPFFSNSPRSLTVTRFALAIAAFLGTLAETKSKRLLMLSLWGGVMAAFIVIMQLNAEMRESNLAALAPFLFAVLTVLPVVVGCVAASLLQWGWQRGSHYLTAKSP